MTLDNSICNLLCIGNQIAYGANKLQEKIRQTKQSISISASMLTSKWPMLKVLGDMTVFYMNKIEHDGNNEEFKTITLTLYNNNGVCGVYTPSLDLTTDFEIISYKSGTYGFSIVQHKSSGLQLKIGITCSDKHELDLEKSKKIGLIGDGVPPLEFLKELPSDKKSPWNFRLSDNEKLILAASTIKGLCVVQSPDGRIRRNNTLPNPKFKLTENVYDLYGHVCFEIADKYGNHSSNIVVIKVSEDNLSDL